MGLAAELRRQLERLRHDDPRLENLQASYTMIEEPSDEVRVQQGALESSNVNVAAAMVEMIKQNRLFDLNIRLVQVAEQNSKTAGSLMSLSRA